MSTVELERPPALGALYRRAALTALARRAGRGRDEALPDTAVALADIAVDRSHLAEYDRVCGFQLTDELPATYLHVLAFPVAMALMLRADFPFPVIGLVHLANRITVHRTVSAAERFAVTVRAADLRPHDRGRRLDVVAVATVDGTEVWRGVSTYLHRERTTADRAGERGGDRAAPRPSAVWRIDLSVGAEYAAVSGDRNPIHTSRLGARVFGFRRPIAHGMWSTARCLAQLAGRLPDAYTVDVSFKLPILLPATVAFSASPAWDFGLHDATSGKPHLVGTVS